jgi:RNA 2',3'-cyclic 3'-phosphodiesterase
VAWRSDSSAGKQLTLEGIEPAPLSVDPVFFAILPDPYTASQIERFACEFRSRNELTGKFLPAERLHISLHSLDHYYGPHHRTLAQACEAAASVRFPHFKVTLDSVMTFHGKPGNHPLILRGGNGVADLSRFHKTLGVAMAKAGLRRLVGGGFTPHVTLLYDGRKVDLQTAGSFEWIVREFVLVRSLCGRGQHVVLGRWALDANCGRHN